MEDNKEKSGNFLPVREIIPHSFSKDKIKKQLEESKNKKDFEEVGSDRLILKIHTIKIKTQD